MVYDEEEKKLLTNSVYKPCRVEDPPDRNLQLAEREKKNRARTLALREWIEDPDINYRLDNEEILSSARSESYCQPRVHSPALSGRRLVVTSQGRMALGKNIQHGDDIALISECDVPFALRPVQGKDSYTLGMPVLLPGVMQGEAWPENGIEGLEEIKIV